MAREFKTPGVADAVHLESAPVSAQEHYGNLHRDTTSEDLPFKAAVQQYPNVVGYFLALTTAILLWGYDFVIVGSITGVPTFQQDYGQQLDDRWIIPASWLGLWSAAQPIGSVFGSISGGWLQDRLGRRRALRIGSVISVAAVAVIFCSYLPDTLVGKRVLFFVGKLIQGYALGIVKIMTMTYVSENAPTALRGSAMALFPTFTLLGQLIGAVVVFSIQPVQGSRGYLAALGSQWALSLCPLVLSFVIPESPAYLVRKQNFTAAYKSMKRLLGSKNDIQTAMDRLRIVIEAEEAIAREVRYTDCFNAGNRRRTWIVIFANNIPAMFGLDLLATAAYFNQVVGMSAADSLIYLIAGICGGIAANGASVWSLSRTGRRRLIIITLAITAVLWTAMGIAGIWSGQVVVWLTGTTLILVTFVVGAGAWPAAYAIMGETSCLRLRAKTSAIGGVSQQLSGVLVKFTLPYIFNPDAGNLRAKTGFVYTGLCIIAIMIMWQYIPEMKGRSVAEIDHMFNLGLPAREFKRWHGVTEMVEELEGKTDMA